MTIIVPSPGRAYSKPSHPLRLDRSHPLARNIVFCAVPFGKVWLELITRQLATHAGNTGPRQVADGNRAAVMSAIGSGAAGGQFAALTGMDQIAGAFSIFAEGSLEVNTTDTPIVRSFEGTNGRGVGIDFDDVNTLTNTVTYWADNGTRATANTDALGANSELVTRRVMVTADGTNALFYTQGALNRTVASSNLPTADTTRRTTMVGDSGTQSTGSASLVLAWNRVLSLQEFLLLHENPWRIFRRPNAHVFSMGLAAGGGGGAAHAIQMAMAAGVF